ncbi:MAG: MucBP domain-containing protein [Lachnospiraceae bacterium]
MSYTVNYLEKGTNKVLHDEKTVENATFDETYTEKAVVIDGYTYDQANKDMKTTTGTNELVFYYMKRADLTYTVKYLEKGTNTVLHETKTVENAIYDKTYTEKAVTIDGYTYDQQSKDIRVTTGTNELVFYYTKRADLTYTVKYLEKGTNTVLHETKTVENAIYDKTYIEKAVTIDGYTYDQQSKDIRVTTGTNELVFYYTKRADLSYTVRYLEKGTDTVLHETKTVENAIYDKTYTEKAVTIDGYTYDQQSKDIRVTTGTNELVFYYTKRADLTYTVKYLEKGTNKILSAEKTVENVIFDKTYTEKAVTIDGYTYDQQSKDIQVTTGTNELVFYYTKRADLSYVVTYHYENEYGVEVAKEVEHNNAATFEAEIPYTTTSPKTYKDANYVLDRIVKGNELGTDHAAIVTVDEKQNVVDIYYALDEIGEPNRRKPDGIPDKYQLVFTYVAENHGTVTGIVKEVVTRYEGDKVLSTTAPAYPRAEVIATPDNGYNCVNWTSDNPSEASKNIVSVLSRVLQRSSATNAEFADVDAIRSAGFVKDTEFTADFIASDATTYKVEVYYEHEGKYSTVPSKTETLAGTTDTKATVAAETYLPTSGYVFDQNAGNVLEGTIAGDNSLVLKVYYKQVFKVTYAPGDHGSFKSQTYTVS